MSFEHVDEALKKLLRDQRKAEREYKQHAEPSWTLPFRVYKNALPILHPDWVAIRASFTLLRPWYSRDDIPFHVFYNPVRRDRVFGHPLMAASSWKGLLRWACRVERGLIEHLRRHGGSLHGWKDPAEVVHLFGPAPPRSTNGSAPEEQPEEWPGTRGALAFRPTWFQKGDGDGARLIGFEIINPHDRCRNKGTAPITYEVVPAGARGTLDVLYAPVPGQIARDDVSCERALELLFTAIEKLLKVHGISGKRTAGWGTAQIEKWCAWQMSTPANQPMEADDWCELHKSLFPSSGAAS